MANEIELKLSEKVHYELCPADDPHGWNVRILEEYPETVISFGTIEYIGEVGDDGHISFNFTIVSTPDETLSVDDLTLQAYCGRILSSVIETGITEGTMIAQNEKTGESLMTQEMSEEMEELYNEYQSGTDSTSESTDK